MRLVKGELAIKKEGDLITPKGKFKIKGLFTERQNKQA